MVIIACENAENGKKHRENRQNTDFDFGNIWPSTDPKNVQKRSFSPTHYFHTFPVIYRRFRSKVLSQTAKNAFHQRSHSKGPNCVGKSLNQRNTM